MRVSYKLYYDFSWGWSSIPKGTKIASLQYLYNILKKEFEIKLKKLMLSLLMDMIKHSQSSQSNKLVIALQYLTNEVSHKAF